MDYARLRDVLDANPEVVRRPAPAHRVAEAVAEIGAFPDDYSRFLREFGWLELDGDDIDGVGDSVPRHLDVVRMTIAERTEPAVPLPPSFVTVMNNGGSDLYCFDTTQVASGADVPIYCWRHEDGPHQELVPEAHSFSEWLSELVLEEYEC